MKGSNVAERRGPAAIFLPSCRLRTRSSGTCGLTVSSWHAEEVKREKREGRERLRNSTAWSRLKMLVRGGGAL